VRTLIKNHRYVNIKKPKETKYIAVIVPMEHREVTDDLFKDFKDVTMEKKLELFEPLEEV
jgi:hypothetical protein